MKKLIHYIQLNLLPTIAVLFLAAIVFCFGIIPLIALKLGNYDFLKGEYISSKVALAYVALIAIFYILSWNTSRKNWSKYKRTYALELTSFLFLDSLVLFYFFALVLVFIFYATPEISFNLDFIQVLMFSGWFLTSYFFSDLKFNFNRISQMESGDSEKKEFFFSDVPIYKTEQEALGRKRFIDDLYDEINQIPFCDSFVIGLNGTWGEGKTSIINLLNGKFESQKNEKFIRIIFEPWHFKDEDAILGAFYNQLDRSISEYYIISDLKKSLLQYQRMIKTGLSLGGINVNLATDDSMSIRELKEKVQAALVKTNKKFLIFIDDLDRLHASEVLLIFKLVRLNANFVNTIFILSYDQIIICDYLKEQKINTDYLEKIVQKQIDLPFINQARLEKFLFDHLERLFSSLNVAAEVDFETRISEALSGRITYFFGTLRDMKRFLNGLRTTLPPIVREINLADFILLEIIRIEYPRIYRDICQNAAFYIESRSLFLGLNEDVRNGKIKQHIESLISNEKKEPELLLELLQELFVVVKKAFGKGIGFSDFSNEDRAKKRIRHPDCFHKYFVLQIFEGELSDAYIETAIESLLSASDRYSLFDQIMNELIKKNQWADFLQGILIFKTKITEELAQFLIEFICRNSKKFEVEHKDLYEPIKLVMNLVEMMDESKIENLLLEIVRSATGKTFLVEIVGACLDGGYYKIYNKIDRKKIIEVSSEQLKEYFIGQNRDIFDELTDKKNLARVLYSWGVQWENFIDNKKMIEDYIVPIIERNANKLLIFLDILPRIHFDDNRAFDFEKIQKRYDLDILKKIISSFEVASAFEPDQGELVKKFLTELEVYNSNNEK